MKTVLKIIIGIILVLGGLFLYLPMNKIIPGINWAGWYKDLWIVFKGTIPAVIILVGFIFFAIAKE